MGMRIHSIHHSEARKLPKSIQDYMKKRFILSDSYLRDLRCFEYEGVVGEKQVRRLNIFSTRDANDKHLVIKTKKDLDSNPQMLLFEGYINKEGKAYAADRRSPIRRKTTISSEA